MIENIVLNGDIFIRKGPIPYDGDEELLKQLSNGIEYFFGKSYDLVSKIGEDDWSYVDKFYIIKINSANDIVLKSSNQYDFYPTDVRKYDSLDQVYEDFINLRDFLSKGKYIGQKFRRTASCGKKDISYTDGDETALYLYNNTLIAKCPDIIEKNKYRIEIIESRYLTDGNYEFIGPTHNEFKNPTKLYSEIALEVFANEVQLFDLNNEQVLESIVSMIKQQFDINQQERLVSLIENDKVRYTIQNRLKNNFPKR